MSERITIGQLYPTNLYTTAPAKANRTVRNESSGPSFNEVLQEKMLKFSHHATKRLEQRGIEIEGEQMTKINEAVEQAAAKGSRESLILMQDMALIVNVPNRTVVTAMTGSTLKDNVFTQIDSAVIIS